MTLLLDDFMTRPEAAASVQEQLHFVAGQYETTFEWDDASYAQHFSAKTPNLFVGCFQLFSIYAIPVIIAEKQNSLLCFFLFFILFATLSQYAVKLWIPKEHYAICKENIWLSNKSGVTFYNFKQIWSFEATHYENNTSDIQAQYARHLDKRDRWGRPAVALYPQRS